MKYQNDHNKHFIISASCIPKTSGNQYGSCEIRLMKQMLFSEQKFNDTKKCQGGSSRILLGDDEQKIQRITS